MCSSYNSEKQLKYRLSRYTHKHLKELKLTDLDGDQRNQVEFAVDLVRICKSLKKLSIKFKPKQQDTTDDIPQTQKLLLELLKVPARAQLSQSRIRVAINNLVSGLEERTQCKLFVGVIFNML
ncbi:OLC1v1025086C1 [Oldenlandia corymbosa var. corymbosa]|uniref:OLC1v1025086C1 n=1 Tax=Oldenlandia corymbosa var. corymbosa TaxID=529605 RepID=A0AAV1C4G5_OLDCO|nr:OLC1v1025086C1 [Oldenlandia corymbosa var. corymbosa]